MFAGTQVSGCLYTPGPELGNLYWTAGQRLDPNSNSKFLWRVKSADVNRETVLQMSYTNWDAGQPDYLYQSQAQSCMHLRSGRSYTWDDWLCGYASCSVCEIYL